MWFQQWEEKSESQARCGSGVSLLKANYSPKSPPKKSCLAGLVLQTAVKGDQPSQTVFDEVADTVPLKHILSTFPSSKNSGHCSLLRVAVYWSSARGKLKCQRGEMCFEHAFRIQCVCSPRLHCTQQNNPIPSGTHSVLSHYMSYCIRCIF